MLINNLFKQHHSAVRWRSPKVCESRTSDEANDKYSFVSLTYDSIQLLKTALDKSFRQIVNNNGPRMEPRGTMEVRFIYLPSLPTLDTCRIKNASEPHERRC